MHLERLTGIVGHRHAVNRDARQCATSKIEFGATYRGGDGDRLREVWAQAGTIESNHHWVAQGTGDAISHSDDSLEQRSDLAAGSCPMCPHWGEGAYTALASAQAPYLSGGCC